MEVGQFDGHQMGKDPSRDFAKAHVPLLTWAVVVECSAVEVSGLEPPTSTLRTWRSTS